jgi:hypothetical protein
MLVVVFPQPPFWLIMAMVRMPKTFLGSNAANPSAAFNMDFFGEFPFSLAFHR